MSDNPPINNAYQETVTCVGLCLQSEPTMWIKHWNSGSHEITVAGSNKAERGKEGGCPRSWFLQAFWWQKRGQVLKLFKSGLLALQKPGLLLWEIKLIHLFAVSTLSSQCSWKQCLNSLGAHLTNLYFFYSIYQFRKWIVIYPRIKWFL